MSIRSSRVNHHRTDEVKRTHARARKPAPTRYHVHRLHIWHTNGTAFLTQCLDCGAVEVPEEPLPRNLYPDIVA